MNSRCFENSVWHNEVPILIDSFGKHPRDLDEKADMD